MWSVVGVDELFISCISDGIMTLLAAKVVGVFFSGGPNLENETLLEHIDAKFKLDSTSLYRHLLILGCNIYKLKDGSVELSMILYL